MKKAIKAVISFIGDVLAVAMIILATYLFCMATPGQSSGEADWAASSAR